MSKPLRARDVGLACGSMATGTRNSITDVPGVRVGHQTIIRGDLRTGVTALLPHGGNIYREKPVAAAHVLNGFGKSTGLVQVDELGTIETPLLRVLVSKTSAGTIPGDFGQHLSFDCIAVHLVPSHLSQW